MLTSESGIEWIGSINYRKRRDDVFEILCYRRILQLSWTDKFGKSVIWIGSLWDSVIRMRCSHLWHSETILEERKSIHETVMIFGHMIVGLQQRVHQTNCTTTEEAGKRPSLLLLHTYLSNDDLITKALEIGVTSYENNPSNFSIALLCHRMYSWSIRRRSFWAVFGRIWMKCVGRPLLSCASCVWFTFKLLLLNPNKIKNIWKIFAVRFVFTGFFWCGCCSNMVSIFLILS